MTTPNEKRLSPAAAQALGMLVALSDTMPKRPEGSECDKCHQKGFHASSCEYVVKTALLEHYNRCKKCDPGLEIDGPGVLCPRGRRLYEKQERKS